MKKIKTLKFFAGIALFAEALMLVAVIIVLSIKKKSVPKALIAALAAGSVLSAWLLISYKHGEKRMKKLREMDAFYDYDYEIAYNGLDKKEEDLNDINSEEDDYSLGFDEHTKLIPDIDE